MNSSLFSLIADETFLGLIVFSLPAKECLYINKIAKEYVEFSGSSPSEFKFSNLMPDTGSSTDRFRPFSDDFTTFEGLTQDVVVKKIGGRTFIADVGVRILSADGRQFLLLMLRDVTLQKKMQRDLTTKQTEIQKAYSEILEQNSQLKELDRAKDKFVALTTHELRTPLSAMIATAEVLALKLYDSDEQMHEFIKTIHTEGLHLLAIVNDILDFAKIQAGKMDFFVEEHDVFDAAKKETINFAKMAEAKKVQLKVENPSNVMAKAFYDVLRFRQALDNVINNAIKFTSENTTVILSVTSDDEYIHLAIKDQGPGIPADSVNKVFNEFETVGNVKSHHKGTGLGMPITKKLMEQMGGKITLVSEVGNGSTFILSLPRKKVLPDEVYRSRPEHTDDLAA